MTIAPDIRTAAGFPLGFDGRPAEPEPFFDDWDVTPHAHFVIPARDVALGDVVLGTHQIEGVGRAEQRGEPAFRFDLTYVVGPSAEQSARLIVPTDQQVRVKRYSPNVGGHRWAWVKITSDAAGDSLNDKPFLLRAGLVPDFGEHISRCCNNDDPDHEVGSTMCDGCVDSWEVDHDVVRHLV